MNTVTYPTPGVSAAQAGKAKKKTPPRNLAHIEFHAPRTTRQEPIATPARSTIALRECCGCGLQMGPGFLCQTIAARVPTKNESTPKVYCSYCVDEHPEWQVIWLLREEDYSQPVTTRRFRQLLQQRLFEEVAA